MANNFNDELPSLTPDRDQVSAYKNTRTTTTATGKPNPKPDQHTVSNTISTVLILVLGGMGSWWFYQQDIKTQHLLSTADARIHELEQKLSITGEEIGVSAGAMKVRLQDLTKRTDNLWQQMDKLWASAWRRNQSDINALSAKTKKNTHRLSKQTKQGIALAAAIKTITEKQTDAEFNVGMLSEQLQSMQTIKNNLTTLKNDFSNFQSKDLGSDKQQIKLAANVAQLSTSQKLLLKRLKKLESSLVSLKKTSGQN